MKVFSMQSGHQALPTEPEGCAAGPVGRHAAQQLVKYFHLNRQQLQFCNKVFPETPLFLQPYVHQRSNSQH